MSALKTTLFLSLVLIPWGVQAQIYMCKDASGRTITSDRPIPECAGRTVRELDNGGRMRREIPAPLTAEQKLQRQQEEEQRRAEEAAAEELRRSDRLLRARYKSEAAIEEARKQALEQVDERIRRDQTVLAAAEKEYQRSQAEADALRKTNATVPTLLQHRIDDAAQSALAAQKAIQEHEADAIAINAKHDALLKRFRELNSPTASK